MFGSRRLCWVGSKVGKICLVFDFIQDTVYTLYACALASILPSLSLIDSCYCTADINATLGSGQGVGVDFMIWMDVSPPQRCETCK
jgi:hypothetical protein